ncbi:ATP-dependent nuclease [Corynebacterium genitalium]|nr:AAA family ATPase [Corynebacterium genitalium]
MKTQRVIELQPGTVVALVGANNSGKSHFLNQIRAELYGSAVAGVSPGQGLIDNVLVRWPDENRIDFLRQVAEIEFPMRNGIYDVSLGPDYSAPSAYLSDQTIAQLSTQDSTLGYFIEAFVRYDDPLSRINEANPKPLTEQDSTLVQLRKQDDSFGLVRKHFERIFNEPLEFGGIEEGYVSLLMAKPEEEMPRIHEPLNAKALRYLEEAPRLHQQGLGMRNVFGLLSRLFTDSRPIVLLDEPEAFLHPPQAKRLGETIAEICASQGRQVFCATHDRSFMAGLASGGRSHLQIERLFKYEDGGHSEAFTSEPVDSDFVAEAKNESRIRFTTILDTLFSGVAVVVENEKDAFFFDEILTSLIEKSGGGKDWLLLDNVTFIPVSGNGNFPSTIALLRKLKTPTLTVGDLDLISNVKLFKGVISSVSASGQAELTQLVLDIHEQFRAQLEDSGKGKVSDDKLRQIIAKKVSVHNEDEGIAESVSRLLQCLNKTGLILIPNGELEDLYPRIQGKEEWTRRALNDGAANDPGVIDFARILYDAVSSVLSSPNSDT